MKYSVKSVSIVVGLVLLIALAVNSNQLIGAQTASVQTEEKEPSGFDAAVPDRSERMLKEGRRTFRFDTFGDEAWWGDTLHLHEAIEGVKLGGIGPGISPATALSLGLKVDLDALPPSLVQQLKKGKVDLNDPAVTLALLKLNSVVGVTGHFKSDGSLKSVGIQCALCHSTVDNALAAGIGHRLDGWANRDLNVGAIIAAAPNIVRSFQSLRPTISATCTTVRIESLPNYLLCISTNSQFPLRRRFQAVSTTLPQIVAANYSVAKRSAAPVTPTLFSRNPAGTCIKPQRSASMTSRRIVRPIMRTGPRLYGA